jgi:hypothetical protein
MRDLILRLHEIEALRNDGIVLVLVLPHLEQYLNHVLNTLVNGAFLQDGAKAIKDLYVGFRRCFSDICANFFHKTDGDLDACICWTLQKQKKDLKRNKGASDGLIDKMSNKSRGRNAYGLEGKVSVRLTRE